MEDLVASNMTYWKENELANALCHLDNTTLRVSMKLCKRFLMKSLTELIQLKREKFAAEDLIKDPPSVAADMLGSTYMMSKFLWAKYSGASDATSVWNGIWGLETLEVVLDAIPSPKYPKGDGDLLWYDHYGKGFDCLCLGTWDVVRGFAHKLPTDLSSEVKSLIGLNREEAIKAIPAAKRPPAGWDFASSDFSDLLGWFKK